MVGGGGELGEAAGGVFGGVVRGMRGWISFLVLVMSGHDIFLYNERCFGMLNRVNRWWLGTPLNVVQ